MNPELIAHLEGLIGLRFKKKPPFGPTEGFNCYAFGGYIYQLTGHDIQPLSNEFGELKDIRQHFVKAKEPQYLDVLMFYTDIIGTRHIGVMQDSHMLWQCGPETNGVARVDIRREPWSTALKGVYRLQ